MTLSFQNLGLIPQLLETLDELGYAEPTPIQAEAIPHILGGQDVMGQAQTGTGKTAAFTLPVLQQMEEDGLQMLVLTPTRELAIQVAEAVHRYGSKLNTKVLPVYGMQSYSRQIRRLQKGVNVVVGTPGRTLDLIRQGALDLSTIRFLVLDEADEMLKMGFIDDVEAIISATDENMRQTSLFSATFSSEIKQLAQRYMNDPMLVAIKSDEVTVSNINQRYYVVEESDKIAALSRLLEVENLQNTLIFTRTKTGAAQLAETLVTRGYPAVAIHGDLPQPERERILNRYRKGHLTILVATDVVARGVDISDVSHVINFDIPQLAIEYVHRIGRTGRAGRTGEAITLVTPRQRFQVKKIEQYIHKKITKAKLPTREAVLEQRETIFRESLLEGIQQGAGDAEFALVNDLVENGYDPYMVMAGMIKMLRAQEAQRPLENVRTEDSPRRDRSDHRSDNRSDDRRSRRRRRKGNEPGMVRLYMNIGKSNGIRPGDIVGSVASKSNLPGRIIGMIDIRQNETYFDVPSEHVDAVLHAMKRSKIRGSSVKLVRA